MGVVDNQTAKAKQGRTGALASGATVFVGFNNCTPATSATAGSAPALPATPAGYIQALVGGAVVKIPYYNT